MMAHRLEAPTTLRHLAEWDACVVSYLREKPDGVRNVIRLVGDGMLCASSFSGWDAPREAWRILAGALGRESGQSLLAFHVLACDVGQLQQRVLEGFSRAGGCEPAHTCQ